MRRETGYIIFLFAVAAMAGSGILCVLLLGNIEETKRESGLLRLFSSAKAPRSTSLDDQSHGLAQRLFANLSPAGALTEGDEPTTDQAPDQSSTAELSRRAALYESLIEERFLLDGMVVNRDGEGLPLDVCDSLLFSSLRYVALAKLGMREQALVAWAAIEKSEDPSTPGHWYRHPRCRDNPLSRDMVIGLAAALSLPSTPSRARHIKELINYVQDNHGFVDKGPFFVSLLSSGLLDILRIEAREEGLSEAELPLFSFLGFSSAELDVFFLKRGYTSHLFSLVLWTEGELASHCLAGAGPLKKGAVETKASANADADADGVVRTITAPLSRHLAPLGLSELRGLRLEWMAQKVLELDEKNLFSQWLVLSTSGALNAKTTELLAGELSRMPQFPTKTLPSECDRFSDYLWQRDSDDYLDPSLNGQAKKDGGCPAYFNGVDFLWIAGLLAK